MFGLKIFGRPEPDEKPRASHRAIVDHLLALGRIAPDGYLKAVGEGPGPARWVFPLFVFFGAAQIVAGLVFFFAYNWRDLPDAVKIALPQIIMVAGFLGWALLPARSSVSAVAGVTATMMIGVSMGVVGQVYQLGADPWTLFAIWAALALPLSLLARNDAHFVVWWWIATTAYCLYADEVLRPQYELAPSIVPAIYACVMIALLMIREFFTPPFAGAIPAWQRWLFVAAGALAATTAGLDEALAYKPFEKGVVGAASLFFLMGAIFLVYTRVRPDRPSRALALFAIAVFLGAAGARAIWRMDLNSAGEVSVGLILSAAWIIVVTTGLAFALRGLGAEKSR